MTIPYSSGKTLSIDQLTNVNINSVANQDVLQYNTTTNEWDNGVIDLSGQDINMNNLTITGELTTQLIEEDVPNLRINPKAPNNDGLISLGYKVDAIDRARFLDIHTKNLICNTTQINEDIRFYETNEVARIDKSTDLTDGGNLEILTKVDGGGLTEKLRVNNAGAIGIGGANFGDAGATLTSNGLGSAVSWERPYFMMASLDADRTYTNNTPLNFNVLTTMNEKTFSTPFNYNYGDWGRLNSDRWACPKTGIYEIYARIHFESATNDRIEDAQMIIKNVTQGTNLYKDVFDIDIGGTERVDNISVGGSFIAEIDQDDEIQILIKWTTSGGTPGIIIQSGFGITDPAEDMTLLKIRRII